MAEVVDGTITTSGFDLTVNGSPTVVEAFKGDLNDSEFQYDVAIVNGNPAIAFLDTAGSVFFIRAQDELGTLWPASAIAIATDPAISVQLDVVNGNPAIVLEKATSNELSYVRASDINGATWGSAVTPFVGAIDGFEFTIVDGSPAVAYAVAGVPGITSFHFIVASDVNGATWDDPSSDLILFGQLDFLDFDIVDGNPAMLIGDEAGGQFRLYRSVDSVGSGWIGGAGSSPSDTYLDSTDAALAVIGGFPTIIYNFNGPDTNTDGLPDTAEVRGVQATDAAGTTWGTSIAAISLTDTRLFNPQLSVIGGAPVITAVQQLAPGINFTGIFSVANDAGLLGASWEAHREVTLTGRNPRAGRPIEIGVDGELAIVFRTEDDVATDDRFELYREFGQGATVDWVATTNETSPIRAVVADALTPGTVLDSLDVSGAVTAGSFSGSGAGLTNIPLSAVQITCDFFCQ